MSCDLEWVGVVGPCEWSGGTVVGFDESHDLGDQIVSTFELSVSEEAAAEDREEQFDATGLRADGDRGLLGVDVGDPKNETFRQRVHPSQPKQQVNSLLGGTNGRDEFAT